MSGYSTSGTWAVRSGATIIGPFDGRTAARTFALEMRAEGKPAEAVPLRSPAEVRLAVELEGTHQPRAVLPDQAAPTCSCGLVARPQVCNACRKGEHVDCHGHAAWDKAAHGDPVYCPCAHLPRRSPLTTPTPRGDR